jgi:hypothetical protein
METDTMKMIEVLFLMMVAMKAAVAITGHPRPLFDALHESGEAREVVERARTRVAFFATAAALVQRSAFVWMAMRQRCSNGIVKGSLESGHGAQEMDGRSPKWTIHYGLSMQTGVKI